MTTLNTYHDGPDEDGRFGIYGGRFVAETLMPLILDVERSYNAAKEDQSFADELDDLLKHYAGRPSPMFHAARLTEHFGGAKIYFKRDELNHTGAHKINNCLAHFCMITAFQHAEVSLVSPFKYANIIYAVVLGYFIWGEVPSSHMVMGAALVIIAGLYIMRREARVRG